MAGNYQLTYTATDAAGNRSAMFREVMVLEDESLTSTVASPTNPVVGGVFDGQLCEADYWSSEPAILSAGLGFSDIIGVAEPQLTEDVVRAAGGAWSSDIDCGTGPADVRNYTSTTTQALVGQVYLMRTPYGPLKDGALGIDGLPIVFSWPVDTSSIDLDDFQVTMNTGDIVRPLAVSPFPNLECNERNTIPIFGEFGNRLPSDDPSARFPAIVSIVGDLFLVGPGGAVANARGLTWENSTSPYDENNGPRFVGAKLTRLDAGTLLGEGIPTAPAPVPPNDAFALYGDEGDFMIRTLSTGGVSPDGVSGVKPNDFERFFRLHATGEDGSTVIIDSVGERYTVRGGTLEVLGLSDLGQPESAERPYDECYDEDLDNYIDIILAGDEAAARSITHVEVPSLEGGYGAFYNPGGPGRTPFDGVTYTQPGPPDMEPVTIALDDPMRVTYSPDETPAEDVLTLNVDGAPRQYLLTVPSGYTGGQQIPLVFNFHGLGSTAQEQLADSQFSAVADREGFIIVTPQAVSGVWAVTGFPIPSTSDDVGFISALIESLSATYSIDPNRIYATGMSLGGFFAVELACTLSETFAAVAPVSGAMTPALMESCAPTRPIPMLQTHGTADEQIPYEASQTTIQWWVDFNEADSTPGVSELPDRFPTNGESVDRLTYANEQTGINVEHFRINGGVHVWPGADSDSDIEMAEAIWSFFRRYDSTGAVATP